MDGTKRLAIFVEGIVQGVGFRPFVYHLATERHLVGWVRNQPDGVRMEVQGSASALDGFLDDLRAKLPMQANISRLDVRETRIGQDPGFSIVASTPGTDIRPSVPADLATCPECVREIETPGERRHGYPFTNCTHCGPRYSIVVGLPYDRPRTSMAGFTMCPACRSEYDDPADRRFHAQPIACPACGPKVQLVSPDGNPMTGDGADVVLAGKILALRGLGGFQLLVDATDPSAVERLRDRKHREAKPLAVMFPDRDALRSSCDVTTEELAALESQQAPIVLVRRQENAPLATNVAPGNPWIGAMLPYTPLHRLVLAKVARPVVCTSGNLSEEPMCTDSDEALVRLGGIADAFLIHDRPIVRPVDDSVARVGPKGLELLRRARGFAPLPVPLGRPCAPILAVGGHLKCTVAIALGDQAVVSQHLGDLGSVEGALLLERTVADLVHFFHVLPEIVVCDQHPEYGSTRLAERLATSWGARLVRVQHHHAHVAACMAEHGLEEGVLGLAWDGTGWGDDATIWGGEALLCDGARFERFSHLRPFSLVGGDLAIREPRRSALGVLDAIGKAQQAPFFDPGELEQFAKALGQSAVKTSSMGRLFDAIAALCGLRGRIQFEGQAAMELEFAATDDEGAYPLPLDCDGVADWGPMVEQVVRDRRRGVHAGDISARFHNALAELAGAIAERAGRLTVVLTGGCFQNRQLSHAVRARLERAGFDVRSPRLFPPNDGGISLGQLFVAARLCDPSHTTHAIDTGAC